MHISSANPHASYDSASPSKFNKSPSPSRKSKNPRVEREFNPSKYSSRYIALKFAYLGQRYNGLEYHTNNDTPLPTIEEELWKALNKARLIFPTPNTGLGDEEVNWEGCEYSKCGRTDKGVSAFGQVVSLRVRSNRPFHRAEPVDPNEAIPKSALVSTVVSGDTKLALPTLDACGDNLSARPQPPDAEGDSVSFHSINDEIPYVQVLNRLLPPDIRILAWCASLPPDFSARFSCQERQYRYFFTQPAFNPTPGSLSNSNGISPVTHPNKRREGWLDIEAMRQAAHQFVGLHDFRNFCKIDPSKQIENFERRVFYADIEEVNPQTGLVGYIDQPGFREFEFPFPSNSHPHNSELLSTPKIYSFTLHGSAFLWHQVRHMVSILFLIGQGLEPPSLIKSLLETRLIPCKPIYEMADDAPLVLWDCIFPQFGSTSRKDALEWIYVGDSTQARSKAQASSAKGDGKFGLGGVVDEMWHVWRRRKMDEILAGTLLDVVVAQGNRNPSDFKQRSQSISQKIFHGGNTPRLKGKYVPVLERERLERVEVVNARYATRKGLLPKNEQGPEKDARSE